MHRAEGRRRSDTDAAASRAHGPLHDLFEIAQAQRKRIGVLQQKAAALGQADVLGIAVEQLHFEVRFKPRDFLGDRRAAGSQAFGGLGKAQAFAHFDEHVKTIDNVHSEPVCFQKGKKHFLPQ
ncbi:hypothetical protein D3C72_2044410 [compost metagenome]